ncbi:hypothetical protein HZB01_01170 [Candidatus Woesearchaeota archaeon]|nr:hypothetical protein [Candidatus Woesearchaeota archaeon]
MPIPPSFFPEMKDRLKLYFKFSPKEVQNIMISVVVMGFMVSFREWGITNEVNVYLGFFNWFNASLIILLTMIVWMTFCRLFSIIVGFRGEFKFWPGGLVFALIVTFVTRGYVWFLFLPGGLIVQHLTTHRIGYFRYGRNNQAYAIACMAGPIALIFLALFFRMLLGFFPENPLLIKAVAINLWFAVINMLPIPPLNGAHIFYFSRPLYAFLLGLFIAIGALLALNVSFWLTLIIAALFGALIWILYYLGFEKGAWDSFGD